uniref:F-box domain-containing protein n=1 Tax=Marseillevirus LCMAC102 TaxID=2506603 RepID=A0A481YTL9_9VIRU|nr:MAG: hypothetical protein LCMAC102_02240 [Marseillevirus LCMAC102]
MNFGDHYIPSDIIGEIISFVSKPRDLICLMGTSKLFRFYAEPQLETKQKKLIETIKKLLNDNQKADSSEDKVKIAEVIFVKITLNQWLLNRDPKFKQAVSKKLKEFQQNYRSYVQQLAKKYQHLI